jgi:hypothetical protein
MSTNTPRPRDRTLYYVIFIISLLSFAENQADQHFFRFDERQSNQRDPSERSKGNSVPETRPIQYEDSRSPYRDEHFHVDVQ